MSALTANLRDRLSHLEGWIESRRGPPVPARFQTCERHANSGPSCQAREP